MSDKLPSRTPRQVAAALERAGFVRVRQTGSHAQYRKANLTVTVPMHALNLRRGTLASILRQARMTAEEFAKFL